MTTIDTQSSFAQGIKNATNWIGLILLGFCLCLAPNLAHAKANEPKPNLYLPALTKGAQGAAITVVEYGSASCSHCAHWYNDNWAAFDKAYLKTGKVRFVFREIVTQDVDYLIYSLGRCAARKPKIYNSAAYFSILDKVWAEHEALNAATDAGAFLKPMARQAGLTDAEMETCVHDQELYTRLNATMQSLAEADHVEQTPTFFVNGVRVQGHEYQDLVNAIAQAGKAPKARSKTAKASSKRTRS